MATETSGPVPAAGAFYKTSVTPNADGTLTTSTSKSSTEGGTYTPITSTVIGKDGKASDPLFTTNASDEDKAAFSNPTSDQRKAQNTAVASLEPYGPNPTAEDQAKLNTAKGTPNAATTADDAAASAAAADEAVSTKDGTRTSYSTVMKYPINLQSEVQDVIKFSILEYSPSLASQGGEQFGSTKSRVVTLDGGTITGSKIIGVITLPIPAGITDNNPVGWQEDSLNMLQSEAANTAKGLFDGGIEGATKATDNAASKTGSNLGDMETAVKSIFIGQAVQSNISSRAYGAVLNNNVELLFSGPSLRTFSFTFLFYPRSSEEAKMVRQIIRAFKQSMSVKRSESSLLLKAPHTFAIQYMTAGQKAHPYLNRFKECALSSCGVDYTPEGTYMTYDGDEKSMTAYRLSLTFQELEPLFDDEYGSDDDNVGF